MEFTKQAIKEYNEAYRVVQSFDSGAWICLNTREDQGLYGGIDLGNIEEDSSDDLFLK